VLSLTIRENIVYSILKKISKVSVVQKKQEKEIVDQYIKELNVKTPSPEQLVKNLSGGNQQKVVLAKALATNCEILIFDEPTRGIDVGAKQEIYNLMCKLVEAGKSIIMISSEMPELIGMSDRIVVMSNGENAGELSKGEYDQTHLLEMASSKL
jgi:ribose transport system ATP-binding protein